MSRMAGFPRPSVFWRIRPICVRIQMRHSTALIALLLGVGVNDTFWGVAQRLRISARFEGELHRHWPHIPRYA